MSLNPKDEKQKSDKYTRDGAKYVCKRCKTKHFTKVDVEKCYDGHPAKPSDSNPKSAQ